MSQSTHSRLDVFCKALASLALSGLALFTCFYNLDRPFSRGDEILYVQATQGMLDEEISLVPNIAGVPRYNKPPLVYWLSYASIKVFGEAAWSHRIPSAVAGLLLCLAVFFMTKQLARSYAAAAVAVVALVGCKTLVIRNGFRFSCTDGLLTLWATLLMWSWHLLVESLVRGAGSTSRVRQGAITGACFGLAVLTKSVAIVSLVPAMLLFLCIRCSQERRRYSDLLWEARHIWMVCGGIAVSLPLAYYLPLFIAHRDAWRTAIHHEIFLRVAQGYHHQEDLFFYLKQLLLSHETAGPGLVAAGLGYGVWEFIVKRSSRMAFLVPWAIVPFVVFTPVPSRLAWYVDPALPAIAILIGVMVVQVSCALYGSGSSERMARWLRRFFAKSPRMARYGGMLPLAAWLVCVAISLTVSCQSVAHDILRDERTPMSRCVSAILETNISPLQLHVSNDAQLDRVEIPHKNFLRPEKLVTSSAELQRALSGNDNLVIIASLGMIEGLDKLTPEVQYLLLPIFRDRPQPLVVLVRAPGKASPQGFNRIRQELSGADFVGWLRQKGVV